jgi:GT2 family glycosyltransferase
MITASVVIYNTSPPQFVKLRDSLFGCDLVKKLYVVDNSPTRMSWTEELLHDPRIHYHFCDKNLGFGLAHNIAIKNAINQGAEYHIRTSSFPPDVLRHCMP